MDNQKGFLLVLIGILTVVFYLMLKPFLQYVLFAVILAFVLHPVQKKISSYIGSSVSAVSLIVLGVMVAIVPVAFATSAVVEDAQDLAQTVNSTDVINTTEIEFLIKEHTGQNIDVETTLNNAIREFTQITFGNFSQLLNLVFELTIGISLMLFLLYYFLKDGRKMTAWMKDMLPLEGEVKDSVVERTNTTTWAVIRGHVLVALAQGLLAGAGIFIAGVPNYVFWTFVMVLLAFIPIVGTILVWGPAAAYLFVTGDPFWALFLTFWGLIVVGLTDNILRPVVVDRRAELHPAVVIIGVLGGVYLFGAAGLFVGPILLGVFKSVLVVFKNNYDDLK